VSAATWARSSKLAAPCAPADFDLFVRRRKNETRLVDWGYYARQIDTALATGFPEEALYVAFSELALRGRPEDLLDDIIEWLGLKPFDFAGLPTYDDALGRQQIRHPGLPGFLHMLYLQYNPWMVYRRSSDVLLPATAEFLNDLFRQPNRNLDLLLRHRSHVAVYPHRSGLATSGGGGNRSASLLPSTWAS